MAAGSASSLDDLQRVLSQVVQDAATSAVDQAQQAPDRLLGILDDALDGAQAAAGEAVQLVEEAFARLKDAVEHPDWLGIVSFLIVRIVELAGDPRLTAVALDPGEGWGRAVGLRYLAPVAGGDSELVVALALGGGDAATHGVVLTSRNGPALDLPAGPFDLRARAVGDGSWRIPFGGPLPPPVGLASVALEAGTRSALLSTAPAEGLSLAVGGPRVVATLSAGTGAVPLGWSVELQLGPAGESPAGVRGLVDLAPLLGALAAVVHMTRLDERYSPKVVFAKDRSPQLDLGHMGAA